VSTLKEWKLKNIPYPLLRLVDGTLGRRYWLLAHSRVGYKGVEKDRRRRRGFNKREREMRWGGQKEK
jgi:hypothetical protein